MNLSMTIKRAPISLNKLMGMHWAAKRRLKDSWAGELEWPTAEEKAKHRRIVKFTRLVGPRERRFDDDNFIGGCKPIRDVLVSMGYILDDDDAGAEFEYSQVSSPEGPGLRIEISEFF